MTIVKMKWGRGRYLDIHQLASGCLTGWKEATIGLKKSELLGHQCLKRIGEGSGDKRINESGE